MIAYSKCIVKLETLKETGGFTSYWKLAAIYQEEMEVDCIRILMHEYSYTVYLQPI